MLNRKLAVALVAVVLVAFGSQSEVLSQEKPASSKVKVEKTKITFDPKTCTQGKGLIYWGLGSSEVKVLGHRDGQCVFEYTAEVEMGYKTYLVRVPVGSGLVKIEMLPSGLGISTSFPLDKAKVIRGGGGPTRE